MVSRASELKHLCESAEKFWPESKGHFICPGCLEVFPDDSPEISIEHIIPKAAKGKVETFLCKSNCNNRFGVKTAKWLGSYLIHTVNSLQDKRRIDQTSNYRFVLNGASLNGKIWHGDSGLNVLFLRDRPDSEAKKKVNDPAELKKLDASGNDDLTITFEDPLKKFVENEKYVKIGMLGAAYFLWFKSFGYSWALQGHLSIIRKMLDDPDKYLPPDGWFMDTENESVQIGFAKVDGSVFPAANIMGKIVTLPSVSGGVPPDLPTNYEMFWLEGGATESRFVQGKLGPHILMVDLQPVFIPDMLDVSIMKHFFAINYDTATGQMEKLVQE